MALRLPRLPRTASIVSGSVPTTAFQQWWQSVAQSIESEFGALSQATNALTLGDNALTLAQSGLNPDGTVKTDKVTTDSMVANAATAPWLEIDDTVVSIGATATTILSTTITKAIDASLLKVTAQVPLVGADAVKVVVTYEVKSGATVVASRDFTLEVDANGTTYLPFVYEHYFEGINAGTYDVVLSAILTTANTCETSGTYHLGVQEFKR